MTGRVAVAVAAVAAIGVALATSVSSLLAVVGHPVSAVSVERIGALFATIPFLVIGCAGLALCTAPISRSWQRPLVAAWALLAIGLSWFGPLAGPYGALFEHATGWSVDTWRAAWSAIPVWPGGWLGGLTVDLARVPILAGALITLAAVAAPSPRGAQARTSLAGIGRHLHLRRHAVRGLPS